MSIHRKTAIVWALFAVVQVASSAIRFHDDRIAGGILAGALAIAGAALSYSFWNRA